MTNTTQSPTSFGRLLAMTLTAFLFGAPVCRALSPSESQVELERKLREMYRPRVDHAGGLQITFSGEPPTLPTGWTIDVRYGLRHAGTLTCFRLTERGEDIGLEEVICDSSARQQRGSVRRAVVGEEDCSRFIETVRALSTVLLEEPDIDAIGGEWREIESIFIAVVVLDGRGSSVLERRFVGFRSFENQKDFLPLQIVLAMAQEIASTWSNWAQATPSEFRACHFASAFSRDADFLAQSDCGWVVEQFIEALACYGNVEVTPTLERLLTTAGVSPRQRQKVERILESPGYWLADLPKDPGDLSTRK